MSERERRQDPRVSAEDGVAITVLASPDAPALEGRTFFCVTRDLSVGGLRFCVHTEVPLESMLELRVEISNAKLWGGWARLRPWSIVPLEPYRPHMINLLEGALLVLEESRANPVPHPPVLCIDEPVQPVIELFDTRREEFPFRWRL